MKRALLSLAVCVFASTACNLLSAQDLPEPKTVLAKYVEATGGKAKYQAIKTGQIKAKMSIPEANISGSIDINFNAEGHMYTKANLGQAGMIERGSDGKVAWEISTIQGARILEGEEAEQMLDETNYDLLLSPEKKYKSMKTVGKSSVNGEECYELKMTSKGGSVTNDFYSVKSGLKLKSVMEVATPMGKIKVETFPSNYKKSKNGITTAWNSEQKFGVMTQKMEITSLEFNVDLGNKLFELPQDIKDLID
ncbi:hypothetical protein N8550_03515 [Pirellulaceae bacterium]|jgi:hypothetical protein|nr:hypothetical protein [Pirellulaceae bacterium]